MFLHILRINPLNQRLPTIPINLPPLSLQFPIILLIKYIINLPTKIQSIHPRIIINHNQRGIERQRWVMFFLMYEVEPEGILYCFGVDEVDDVVNHFFLVV